MDADVLVLGAGPCGAAAAHDLATAGLTVRVLDRPAFPHAKPCAGGVTMKALQRLRFDIQPVVRETADTLNITLRGHRPAGLAGPGPVCVLTHRPELDAYCMSQAEAAGAGFERITALRGMRQTVDHVELETTRGRLRGLWLVAADGAHSAVRRWLFGQQALRGAVAVEGLLAREHCQWYPGMTFDFGACSQGYGWLFPKGDHVNVGLYVWDRGRGKPARQALAAYARERLGSDRLTAVRGYPEGTWGHRVQPAAGRVLLGGDAAGLAEPLLGEGIYGAVRSGQDAAAAILGGGDVARTYTLLVDAWRDEIRAMHRLSRLYYGALPLSYGVLKHGLGQQMMAAFARGMTLGQAKRALLAGGLIR